MTAYKYFIVEVTEGVAQVKINRPDKANSFNQGCWEEMHAIFESLADGDHVRAIVLSGEGKHFTAGIDLELLMSVSSLTSMKCGGRKGEKLRKLVKQLQAPVNAIEACPKPVLAAIHSGCIGGGFWGPNSNDMALIRSHFAQEPDRLRTILNDKNFKKMFGKMRGEQLKSAPRGYSADHPAIDLLRYKQFFLFREFTDKEVLDERFPNEALKTLLAIRPFFDYMSEILTTNLNGESLLED